MESTQSSTPSQMTMEQFFSKCGEYIDTETIDMNGIITNYHQWFYYTKGVSMFDGRNWEFRIH